MPAIDQTGMRRLNASATLRAFIDADAALTFGDLVTQTRLSRRTLELIIADLTDAGWVRDAASPTPTGVGRPKKFYELIPTRAVVISVVIDPPRMRAVVADVRGVEIAFAEADSDPDPEVSLRRAAELAASALQASATPETDLVAVAVGLGGTISPDGVVLTSPVGAEWRGRDVRAVFAERFDCEVLVENDMNLSALAARADGTASGHDTFAVLVPGVRVSAGFVVGGELHRGFRGAAGELVRLPDIAARAHAHPLGLISSPDESERAAAREMMTSADPDAQRAASEFFDEVARLVAVLAWVVAPPLIIVAGGFDGVEEQARALLRSALSTPDAPEVDVSIMTLTPRTPLVGGVHRALDASRPRLFTSL